ncbi:MAG: helix-turn-helix transcriptional regulator, partial [Bacilli bacterium]|nr:helix-turn-helix transcriptional regulator [Bacilli bacterium]
DKNLEVLKMRLLYTKPELKDLSQGSRIAFVRQFRLMTQDEVSDKLGLTGECKRRTMTRYEKGERNPKDDRTYELSKILKVNYNAIKKYDFKDQSDILYTLMWLEELLPRYQIDLSRIPSINDDNIIKFKEFINEWEEMRTKRFKREISYEQYVEWKLNLEV